MPEALIIYIAGELFDHKHLSGNALLSDSIHRTAAGRLRCFLPQDVDLCQASSLEIRNTDLKHLINADIALFNFDGTDLDSGTLVEYMVAKFCDIPAVILRSDFRSAGDQKPGEDSWNLMCSFFPRCRTIHFDAMERYHRHLDGTGDHAAGLRNAYDELAQEVISACDSVISDPPLTSADLDASAVYEWMATVAGSGLIDALGGTAGIQELISEKKRKGLL
jgi:nucleoside 2-deoxyribosyltransferase